MIQVSQAQIEEQIQQERDQISQGLKALRDNTMKAENKAYASSSVYGFASIQELVPHVEKEIEGISTRIRKGANGVAFKEIDEYLQDIEPLAAAGITAKVVFDRVFSCRTDDDNLLVNVYDAVGTAIMHECQLRYYERKAPGLLKALKENYWHKSCGTQQKISNIQIMMNRSEVNWKTWHRKLRIKLGNVLVDCVLKCSGWFDPFTTRAGAKTQTYLIPSEKFLKVKDSIINQAELFSAQQWVMLVPPRDWTANETGGYLLDEVMRGHDLVRKGNSTRIQGDTPINFINKIQRVGYTVNRFVYDVADHLYEKGIRVGKEPKFIPPTSTEPLPPKPVDIETNEVARKQYCRAAAVVHNRNHQLVAKSVRTRMTMEAAKRVKDRDRFYVPWSFDYRGRVYPIPSFMTPQDTDFGKSLLKFADSAVMTPEAEDWLRFQVATTYGLDKKPIKERLEWVVHNHNLITCIATDPLGYLPEWESADEPWQFLAACEEYYHTCIVRDRNYSSLPVATDATCSGLQILAGLCRDAETASLVNVLPATEPQDAYKAVANNAKGSIDPKWRDHVDRGVAKRLVMTIPYNAKFKSNWKYVNAALNDPIDKGGKNLNVPTEDVTAITHALRESTFKTFPGPTRVMKWIESEVGKAMKKGKKEIVWSTPSGFIVSQKLMKAEVVQMKLQLLGQIRKVTVATGDSDEVNKTKHKAATAPNLIHSLDASLLHLSALRFDAPISLIHDSVLCRAGDMSLLSKIVRETYMHLFAEHDYLRDWAQQIGAESEPPIIDTLKPESVIESTYFFC